MSAQITSRDGVFTVREPAWHGLAHVFEDYPTREQAQKIAHPWEPVREPAFRRVVKIENDVPVSYFEEIPDWQLAVRSDDGFSLGMVRASRENFTNSEMYDILEVLSGENDKPVRFETGGSLYGGSKVFLLARLEELLTVPGDPQGTTIPYLAIQNGHSLDGGAFRLQATMVRIVCDNTAQMADLDAQGRGHEWVIKHTKNMRDRVEEARRALAGWRGSVERFQLISEHLIGLKVTARERELFLDRFVPLDPGKVQSDRVVANVEAARQAVRDILASPTCEGIDETAWGLVQASVEYGQQVRRTRSKESGFVRAYLDRSVLTANATKIAEAVALAA